MAGEISGNVTRFDGPTGAFIDTFIPNGPSGVTSGHGLTFGPDGNLYVSSQFAGNVDVFVARTHSFKGTASCCGQE